MTVRPWYLTIGLLIAVALVATVWVVDDDTDTSTSTTTTAITTTTSSTVPTTVPPVEERTAIWPFPGDAAFDDPLMAAQSFAVEYLGFTDPVVGEFQQGDSRSGEVPIRPVATGPVTTVLVRQLSGEDTWSVLGAATAGIDITEPAALEAVSSPVRVAGRAVAFEGTVLVEVREDGQVGAIGAGFVTGGGDVMRPFEGLIAFETPQASFGAIVAFTRSMENGQVWEAAALRVGLQAKQAANIGCGPFSPPPASVGEDEMLVTVYFSCGDEAPPLVGVPRVVPKSTGVLRASLEALLAGPTADERAAELASWFSAETAAMVQSVNIVDGHAIVDFDAALPTVIPNASASAGSLLLLTQLDATVFQHRSVASVEYRLDGDCDAFSEWLQLSGCDPRTR